MTTATAECSFPSISYIYYPMGRSFGYLSVGHVELEIDGTAFSLVKRRFLDKKLQDMIMATKYQGRPFFRFEIRVTQEQFEALKKIKAWDHCSYVNCAVGVANTISHLGQYSIPLPLRLATITSAAYLACAYILGSKRVTKIEYYADSSRNIRNIFQCCMGILLEVIVISAYLFVAKKVADIFVGFLQHSQMPAPF
ncbi:MAG: hypothetical protein JSR58_06775 [Verrucomicrobia bacterium]|nr:hypothetical protein [Verrucomicrobiota bacterium]